MCLGVNEALIIILAFCMKILAAGKRSYLAFFQGLASTLEDERRGILILESYNGS